jgi:hypothetical protein
MFRPWLALVVTLAVVLLPRSGRADPSTAHTVSVAVLAIDSDDAEEQADALTGALRSRIRASQGWSLIETSQSLGMLTAALRCPTKPIPADCEQRIAEQVKSDRYIFGYVTKGPQGGQVSAEIHLYQKSKPDTVIRESYADNLKDQNDDMLRKIAQRVLERLGGNAVGTIAVRMGSENGEVIVDGDKRVPLQSGAAHLELSPGSHSVEVAAVGQPSQKRNVLVTAGKETVIDLALATPTTEPPKPEKPFPVKKVIGAAAMAVGIGLGVFAVERLMKYDDLKDQLATEYPSNKFVNTGGSEVDACQARLASTNKIDESACKLSEDAKSASTVGIVTAIGGGVFLVGGAYLFFLSGDSDAKSSTSGKARAPRITPTLGFGSGGLSVSGSF